MIGKIQYADAATAFELGADDFCLKAENLEHVFIAIIEFE